jgi:CheY-like chemotaxis protein
MTSTRAANHREDDWYEDGRNQRAGMGRLEDPVMKSILLVEDDVAIRRLLTDEFIDEGYRVEGVPDGKEALERLKQGERPNLIILDIRMPRMDGLETMGYLLKMKLDLPVIIYSAYPSYRNDYLAGAADAYVVKSPNLTELKNRVQTLI